MLYFKMKVKKKKRGEEIEEEIMPKSKKKKKINYKSNVLCFLFWIGFGVQKLRTQHYKTRAGCQF